MLARFERTDWGEPVVVGESLEEVAWCQTKETLLRLLRMAAEGAADFTLLLEDDVEPNPRLRHNLERWPAGGRPFMGSLYRCCQPVIWRDGCRRALVGVPEAFWGGPALVVSRATAGHVLRRWTLGQRSHDVQLPLVAAEIGPVY
jgi:hypothetical protein